MSDNTLTEPQRILESIFVDKMNGKSVTGDNVVTELLKIISPSTPVFLNKNIYIFNPLSNKYDTYHNIIGILKKKRDGLYVLHFTYYKLDVSKLDVNIFTPSENTMTWDDIVAGLDNDIQYNCDTCLHDETVIASKEDGRYQIEYRSTAYGYDSTDFFDTIEGVLAEMKELTLYAHQWEVF